MYGNRTQSTYLTEIKNKNKKYRIRIYRTFNYLTHNLMVS